ncbi:hypothetical protein RND81_13G215900 [Saponaria officinalis]|uniref:HTH La-type RNA-binding domain-containing protein n=1 Tax=Saponaria officinalis TaxID=3572 RepID=A0AAW1H2Q8_SAPOF
MAATANSTPLSAATAATAASLSPRSPSGIARTVSPPWIQIVRGPEAETPSPESGDSNAAVSKASAWNKKPASARSSAEVGEVAESGGGGGATVVMGAELWPSLSECTKASPKNDLPDLGSTLPPQVTGIDTSSTTRVPLSVRSPSSTTQKPTNNHANHHLTSTHGQIAKQRSMKREGEGNSQANGVFSHQSSQPAGDGSHHPHHNVTSPKPNPGSSENPGKDNVQSHGHRESGQRNASGEHPHHRNSYRKGNGGPQSRGDGSHQTYGGRRRDQERGNHDWNHQKSFNGRDASLQPSVVSRGFVRPPPVSAPFVHPPPLQPFINPTMPDLPIFYLPPGMQFVAPVPQMYYPAPDPELYSEILKQINYYFSNENLVRDTYLRGKMDDNGWIGVDVISNFNKVKSLTNDTFQILEAVRSSSVVEVQGDKIRRRDDWMRWIMPPSVQPSTLSDLQSPKGPPISAVTDGIQSVSLDGKTYDPSIIMAPVGGTAAHVQVEQRGGN